MKLRRHVTVMLEQDDDETEEEFRNLTAEDVGSLGKVVEDFGFVEVYGEESTSEPDATGSDR